MRTPPLYALTFLLLFAILLISNSCRKDQPTPSASGKTLLTIRMNTMAGTEPFKLNKIYFTSNGQKYLLNQLRFYLGNITLLKSDTETLVPVKDIVLVEYDTALLKDADPKTVGTSFTFEVPAGNYVRMMFGLGVPESLNGEKNKTHDPSKFPNDHALSLYRDTDWGWTYRFTMIGGKAFTSDTSFKPLQYHIASDTLYKSVSITRPFKIIANQTNTFTLNLDVNKIFYQSTADDIDMQKEYYSHSTGAAEINLAFKVTRNLARTLAE